MNDSIDVSAFEYEYDVNESFDTYDWAELVPAIVVYSIVLLLGISGNALIIFTIARYQRLKTITNIFLASLASADLLLVLICVPVNLAKLFSYTWTFGVFLCKWVHYMQNVSAICSVLTLTAMSIERYYAIVHPIRAQYLCTLSQARKVITATWTFSFVLASPTLFIQTHLPVGDRIPAFWCVRHSNNPLGWKIYEIYMLVVILILPLTIMIIAYGSICNEIWQMTLQRGALINEPVHEAANGTTSMHRSRSMETPENMEAQELNSMSIRTKNLPSQTGSKDNASKCRSRRQTDYRTAKQVVKMLVAVVVLFAICWAPYLIDNVLTGFDVLPHARTGAKKHMRTAFHLLAYFNSCINPLVYGFMSRNFRRGFKSALRLSGQQNNFFCCSNKNAMKTSVDKFSQSSRLSNRNKMMSRGNEFGYNLCILGNDALPRGSKLANQINAVCPGNGPNGGEMNLVAGTDI